VKAFCGRSAALIPNGVDGKLFHPQPHNPEPAARLGISGRVLGFAGEARAKKGLNALLLAFRGLAANQPLSLLLVGGARQGEDLGILTVFQKQNPDLKVILTDFVPLSEMPAYYNLMDVVLIPSLHDGLPNALLEAMACARPVVAARSGGIPDALTDHENGLLVEPGDEHALAQAVQSLLDDPLLCQRLGHAARVTVLDRFTPMQELKKTVEVYAEALSRNNRR
jgi:glycosyltransferase involved in cell wall biosynthesis